MGVGVCVVWKVLESGAVWLCGRVWRVGLCGCVEGSGEVIDGRTGKWRVVEGSGPTLCGQPYQWC